jgi:hypothetical protein
LSFYLQQFGFDELHEKERSNVRRPFLTQNCQLGSINKNEIVGGLKERLAESQLKSENMDLAGQQNNRIQPSARGEETVFLEQLSG